MKDLRIIFMGTPEFAVASLEILVINGYNVVAVITAPDKPSGRGQKVVFSPIKEIALKHDIPVLQPTNLKATEFINELRNYKANLQLVVAFRMLPEVVWGMPELGTINLHASLLPQYRGAAPINWVIINGEKETGVTTFFLKHEIDTGEILLQEKEAILADDDAGSLYERLKTKGAALVLKSVKAAADGNVKRIPQSSPSNLKQAPKIYKETCEINWDKKNIDVLNFVRGLSPYPTAWTTINSKLYKLYKVHNIVDSSDEEPGCFKTDQKTFLNFKTRDGWISITEIQPEGKRKMTIEDFFRGNKI